MEAERQYQDQKRDNTPGDLNSESLPSPLPAIHHKVTTVFDFEIERQHKALLVDFDGTVAHTFKAHYEPYRQVFMSLLREADVITPDDEILTEDWLMIYLKSCGKPELPTCETMIAVVEEQYACSLNVTPEGLLARRNEYVAKNAHCLDIEPNMPLIACLKAYKGDGGNLILVTASCDDFVTPILEHLELDTLFDQKLTADKLALEDIKPSGAHYEQAVDLSSFTPGEVLAIEDTFTGVLSALRANVSVLLIPPPHMKDALLQTMDVKFGSAEGRTVLDETQASCVILLDPEGVYYLSDSTEVND